MRISERLPWGLVGMVAVVAIVEGFLARHEVDVKTGWHWEWTVNGSAAKRKARDFPILCLGDSQVNHGIIPAVMEKATGSRTLNLALSGGQATTTFFQLRRALESGAKPEAVVVDFFVLLLNHGPEENEERWADLLTPRECLELAWAIKDAGFVAKTALAKAFVSIRERDGIRKGVIHALNGTPRSERHEAVSQRRNQWVNNGGLVFGRNPGLNLGDLDMWYKLAFRKPEWCAPYHARFLKRFLDLAASRDVKVYWVVPPLPPAVQAKFAERGQDERFDKLIASVLVQYPNVRVLDARTSGYPHEVFVDHGHLDRVGARTFTADVGGAMTRAKAGDPARWVRLPAFRPMAEDPPVEDIGQSRRMIAEVMSKAVVR